MTMPVKDAPFLEERTAAVMESVFNDPIVKKALEQAVPQEIFTIEEQIEICEVPAPPMKEQTRAAMIAEKINSYGLEGSCRERHRLPKRYGSGRSRLRYQRAYG